MMNDVGVVLLRPPTVFLRAPGTVLACDNTAAGDVRKLGNIRGIRRGDNRMETAEVERDACIERGQIVRA